MERAAQKYAATVTRDQGRIQFDTAREIVRRSPEIRRRYGVEALANAIWQERTSSNSSDAKALDGLNVQVAVCDEIASHKTSEVYDVLLTAMGKRSNPLLLATIDPWIEASWIKANPSCGQAVPPDAVRAIMRQARNNPAQEAAAKTRHLNRLRCRSYSRPKTSRQDGPPTLSSQDAMSTRRL